MRKSVPWYLPMLKKVWLASPSHKENKLLMSAVRRQRVCLSCVVYVVAISEIERALSSV